MKLYLAIYLGIHVVGSVGPLPVNERQCRDVAVAIDRSVREAIRDGKDTSGTILTTDQIEQAKTMRFRCEWRSARPELGEPA